MKKKTPKMQKRDATQVTGETFDREFVFDRKHINEETRTVTATLSSTAPVERFFGNEVLDHGKDNVDLARSVDGLPLLFNHDPNLFIGLARNVRLDGGKLRAELQFSENARAQEVFKDVQSGLLKSTSLRYKIHKAREGADEVVHITRWEPIEATITPIPADPSVGINRNAEGSTMDQKQIDDAVKEAREAELSRMTGIRTAFAGHVGPKFTALREECLTDGERSIEASQAALLALIGSEAVAAGGPGTVKARHDSATDQMAGMEAALLVRFGIETDKVKVEEMRKNNEYGSFTLSEMAREFLKIQGVSMRGMDMRGIVGSAIMQRTTQDSTDFTALLANVAHVSLTQAYWDAPETWRAWCRVGNLSDFKQADRANISEFDDLPVVAEGASYTEGSFTDLMEPIQLATYGKNWTITRQAIINDSADAFTRVPRAMGLAAARVPGDLAYNILIDNDVLNQDSVELFSIATHTNLNEGAVPMDATIIDTMKVAMALQTGPKGTATLGIRPAHLIVPVSIESLANTLMAAQYNPASTAGTLEPNPVQGLMSVVAEHRLDAATVATQWYMAANSAQWDTLEVAFLNGVEAPYQERKQDSITDDNITYKVRMDVGAKAIDFRGMQTHTGATAA
jgi:HK97 family phage prohead protease